MGGCLSSQASPNEWAGAPAYETTPRSGQVLGGDGARNPKVSAAEAARAAALARFEARPADLKKADERDAKAQLVARLSERYRLAGREVPFGLSAMPLAKLRVMCESGTLPG